MKQGNLGRVLFWMSGALLSFSAMAVSIRSLAGTLNVFEILSIRSGSGVLILLSLIAMHPPLRHFLRLRHIGVHALRNSVHLASQVAWTKSITLLPLATVFAIEFTTPALVALLAVFFLGERLTANRLGTVALGFAGVLVIIRPGIATFQPAALLVVGAALGFAVTMVATKRLTAMESTFAILFWMNLMQLPMNLAGSDWLFAARLAAGDIPAVAGVAISGLTSHYCLTNAFRAGDALVVVPLDFLRIPLIAVVGWLAYGEALDPVVFLGAGLIIAGIIWNLRAEARQRSARDSYDPAPGRLPHPDRQLDC